jgi:hypothetical protein
MLACWEPQSSTFFRYHGGGACGTYFITLEHRLSGVASVLDSFSSQLDLPSKKESADSRNNERSNSGPAHHYRSIGHFVLRNQIAKNVWFGLLCLGLALCIGGFWLAWRLFAERRDIAAIAVQGLLVPAGALLFSAGIIALAR